MKQYISELQTMFGTWEEDFKTTIEKNNPNLEEDFNDILQALPPEIITEYLSWIIDIGNTPLISDNIDTIMRCASEYTGYQKVWIVKTINLLKNIQDPNIDNSIANNLIPIIKGPYTRGNPWVIINFYNNCKDIGNSRDIIEENYGEILNTIFSHNEYLSNNPAVLDRIKDLISKIAEQENVTLSDIEDAGSGQYSDCMKIGTTILKFGKNRILEDLPVHRRILQPKLRINIPQNYNEQIDQGTLKPDDLIAIECQDEVDTKWDENMPDNQKNEFLYSIYKDLRNSGFIWTDIKPENVGRLLKPNIINYTVTDSNGEAVQAQTSLPVGEFVIFDTDRIYEKDKLPEFKNVGLLHSPSYEQFEERYNNEQKELASR
ncbi:MAG: hypothetical protein OSJ66_03430 [Clostridia bacterium]|nr:hypothetical protein [Clostridia bacterium]